jgi:hypothetical protein
MVLKHISVSQYIEPLEIKFGLVKYQVSRLVAYTCNYSYSGGGGGRIVNSRLAWAKAARSYLNSKIKTELGIAQVVE